MVTPLNNPQEYDLELVELEPIETPDGWDIAEHVILGAAAGIGLAIALGC
ncbi:hypothetical protein [Deinococcus planocerae]|nr:hypothetical protein [Deinococcus planocerae]